MTLHKMLKEHNEYCKVGLIYYWWDSIFDKKKNQLEITAIIQRPHCVFNTNDLYFT